MPSPLPDFVKAEKWDAEALLHRILVAVEKDRQRGRLELAIAIILSLATLGSTWCGYQSGLWGDVQRSKQFDAETAERQAAEDTIVGLQLRSFDAMELREYWSAIRESDIKTGDAVYFRMRPQLQRALKASLTAGVLDHSNVAGPLERPEYVLSKEQNSKLLRAEAALSHKADKEAGQTSGRYATVTLMFASVLFFGGISGTFTVREVRVGLAGVSLALFLVTIAILIGLPACKGSTSAVSHSQAAHS